ncbi:MAG: hypothetical protein WD049_09720 [Candidatus Paceibacterota bacterium]
MNMTLLSKDLVSLEYREQLQRDLARASVCRFLIAFISNDGMESIGRHLLNRVLRDDRSFGLGSLSCSCGYEPLLRMQSELPDLRLKYFMDPLVKEDGEPSEISLFHSKLVYLWLEREGKSVVYIGSHNWSRRALGPQGPSVRLWSGREVQIYDFEFPTQFADSSQIDGSVRPKYQFHLEVERVVLPATGSFSQMPDYVWSPESFSVAASRDAARMEETPGYYVEPEREQQILDCLSDVLFVQAANAKVLPYSSADRMKVGRRVSTHPLHETFLGPEWQETHLRDEYYERSLPGSLVAELDSQRALDFDDVGEEESEELARLQRVFTAPIDRLVEAWGEAAKLLKQNRRSGDREFEE